MKDVMRRNRLRRGVAVLLAGLALGGCDAVDQLLQVENPERIRESEIDDPQLVPVLVSSVVGEMADALDNPFIWTGSLLTDEQVTGINWEDYARVSQRIALYNEGPTDEIFDELSEARVMADTVSAKLRNLLENPETDRRLALTLAYAGYSYILLGDAMCEATINVGEKKFQPIELYEIAVAKLEDALQVAEAANAPDVANLARVGLARAHLNLGNDAEVMRYAAQVPTDFVWWVEYSETDPSVNNTLYDRTHGGNHALGVHPSFFVYGSFREQNVVDQTDPRIQHTPQWETGHNALTPLYKPFQPLLFSGFTGNTVAEICANVPAADCTEDYLLGNGLALPERETDIALASGIEALHHYYEAAGAGGTGPAGTTLAFVNARRAFGNQTPVDLSGAALEAELREQRRRDLFLAGFRLGDLRRWLRQGVGDFFPSGPHVNAQWGEYGTDTCFEIPRTEYEGNPNVKQG